MPIQLVAAVQYYHIRLTSFALTVLFLAYPTVSSYAFLAFNCVAFDGVPEGAWANRTVLPEGAHNHYLGTDLSVLCYTQVPGAGVAYSAEYAAIRRLAAVAILLFPVGVPSLYALLLFSRHGELRSGRAISALARALRFLHREYERQMYFWELLVMAQKPPRPSKAPPLQRHSSPSLQP